MQPVIKWSGSKRSQAKSIVSFITKKYDTFYQPFCGSCAILMYILQNKFNLFKRFVCSDLNQDLINSYNLIKKDPSCVINGYTKLWNYLNNQNNSIQDKKCIFGQIRERLNKEHNPIDFIFIMRTTTNGMPRYNKNGQFNNSFHVTRNGIIPDSFAKIILQWSNLLNLYDVKFLCQSYDNINPNNNDFVYLDPPYANTKGMYFGDFDNNCFFDFLKKLKCDFSLSYDGVAGEDNFVVEIPKQIYKQHLLIKSGNSSFRRVIGKNKYVDVYESLYLNFKPQNNIQFSSEELF